MFFKPFQPMTELAKRFEDGCPNWG